MGTRADGRWDWEVDRLAYFDVETTGVFSDVHPPYMLEVALVVTDGDLEILDQGTAVIDQPEYEKIKKETQPFVLKMHTKSGLWREIELGYGVSLEHAERMMINVLDSCRSNSGNPIVWAGSSSGSLDRPIIRRDMPTLYRMIHHRTLDVSALMIALRNWGGMGPISKECEHRALQDCLDAIELTRKFRERFQGEFSRLEAYCS